MRWCIRLFLLLGLLLWLPMAGAQSTSAAALIRINGAIGPATQDFFHRSLAQAEKQGAPVVILQIDTPGGLSDSMRGIIQDILASSVPIIAYVAPSGARAASAGTYIVYASQIAAMAPGTNIGAASPVNLGPGANDQTKTAPSTEDIKMMNDAQAYIRSLAELRHRNVAWAQLAVTKAASLSATEALQQQVIDIVAGSLTDLLNQADGKTALVQGHLQTIHTQGLSIHEIAPDWRTQLLATITDPSVAYILLMVGIYGLFFEFMSPGMIMPGVLGAISLLLALYAFQLLPIDYAGLSLMILGIACIVAEMFMPAFGALGIGGAIAFIAGSIMLLKPGVTGFSLPLELIIVVTVVTSLFFILVLTMAIRSRRRPVVTGREAMVGQLGVVELDRGQVWIHVASERWQAIGDQHLQSGQQVQVLGVKGLKLLVKPYIEPQSKENGNG